mmetsp:Transcript_57983/g.127100  ORF Transcript_57983/g.127100 Transcript_57983/m.127100 type:complete len:281 (-) Transcript_57983:1089-1931(-)
MKPRPIDNASNHLPNVVGDVGTLRQHTQNAVGIVQGRLGLCSVVQDSPGHAPPNILDDLAAHLQRCLLRGGKMVAGAGLGGVHHSATQGLLVRVLPCSCLHQRRTSQVDCAIVLHDDGLVAHGRSVRATSGAHAADNSNLGNAKSAHSCLIVELSTTVHKSSGQSPLERQVPTVFVLCCCASLGIQLRTTTINQIHTRKPVLLCNLLRPEPLLVPHRECYPALDGGVCPNEHHLATSDDTNAAHGPATVHAAAVHLPARQGGELHKISALVYDLLDALPH